MDLPHFYDFLLAPPLSVALPPPLHFWLSIQKRYTSPPRDGSFEKCQLRFNWFLERGVNLVDPRGIFEVLRSRLGSQAPTADDRLFVKFLLNNGLVLMPYEAAVWMSE